MERILITPKELRLLYDFSPGYVGNIIGMSGNEYLFYERNPSELNFDEIQVLARFYKINYKDLCEDIMQSHDREENINNHQERL